MLVGLFHHYPESAITDDILRDNRVLVKHFGLCGYYYTHIFHLGATFVDAKLYLFEHYCDHVLFKGIISKWYACQLFEDTFAIQLYERHLEVVLLFQRTGWFILEIVDNRNRLVDSEIFRPFDKEHHLFLIGIGYMDDEFTYTFVVVADDLFLLGITFSPKGRNSISIKQKLLLFSLELYLEVDGLAKIGICDYIFRV